MVQKCSRVHLLWRLTWRFCLCPSLPHQPTHLRVCRCKLPSVALHGPSRAYPCRLMCPIKCKMVANGWTIPSQSFLRLDTMGSGAPPTMCPAPVQLKRGPAAVAHNGPSTPVKQPAHSCAPSSPGAPPLAHPLSSVPRQPGQLPREVDPWVPPLPEGQVKQMRSVVLSGTSPSGRRMSTKRPVIA